MSFKTLIVAAVLAVAPTLSLAGGGGCSWDHQQQAMSCGEGTVWDEETGQCVKVIG